jgi:hypothetical protein
MPDRPPVISRVSQLKTYAAERGLTIRTGSYKRGSRTIHTIQLAAPYASERVQSLVLAEDGRSIEMAAKHLIDKLAILGIVHD